MLLKRVPYGTPKKGHISGTDLSGEGGGKTQLCITTHDGREHPWIKLMKVSDIALAQSSNW